MKPRLLLLVLLLILLAACAAAGGTEPPAEQPTSAATAVILPTATVPAVDPEADPSDCPEPVESTKLLEHRAYGYCLLYPANYQVMHHAENSVNLVLDSPLNVTDPRLDLTVEAAGDRTATQLADELMGQYEGFDVERSTVTMDGVEAEVLNNLPGQDLNRRVLVVHEGLLYDMFFSPVDPEKNPEGQIERFYNDILESFRFVPVVADEPLRAGPECPTPTADTELLRNEADGYCLLYPVGYSVEQPVEGEAVIFYGSMLDVEHPKLLISVTDTNGREAHQVFEDKLAEYEGFELESSFGLLADGEPAFLLDKVPGQDLNRQVVVIRDDQVYTLTFLPSDPAAGEIYQQMEAMYELAMSSFSFLWP